MTQGMKQGEMCRQSTAAGQVLGKRHIERTELGPGHAAETLSRGKNMFPGERQGPGAGRVLMCIWAHWPVMLASGELRGKEEKAAIR